MNHSKSRYLIVPVWNVIGNWTSGNRIVTVFLKTLISLCCCMLLQCTSRMFRSRKKNIYEETREREKNLISKFSKLICEFGSVRRRARIREEILKNTKFKNFQNFQNFKDVLNKNKNLMHSIALNFTCCCSIVNTLVS